MGTMKIVISSIKNIKSCEIEFPLENGLNLLVGNNACGKSTLLLALSQALLKKSFKGLKKDDYDNSSSVEIDVDGLKDIWCAKNSWRLEQVLNSVNGMYEGSLFYGTRFDNSKRIDILMADHKLDATSLTDADEYVKEQLSLILHGVRDKYTNLKRIKNRAISKKLGFRNTPYFSDVEGHLISQYRMSSGECLLISLLHFIYNAIVRQSLPNDKLVLVLIDEIELALHPMAVSRFIDLLNKLISNYKNLMVILTSHSLEVIQKINPRNIYKMANSDGVVNIINPCFPSYTIRDVYRHDGYDFLFLVEDELAKIIVNKVIDKSNLRMRKLIHVIPVGGWENVLRLQKDLLINNVLGFEKMIVSILDGDVKEIIPNSYSNLKKTFLPISSVEKFLYKILTENIDNELKKIINDKYFTVESLDSLVAEFNETCTKKEPHADKKLYKKLKKNLEQRNITEAIFIEKLSDDIISHVDFNKFENTLKNFINNIK